MSSDKQRAQGVLALEEKDFPIEVEKVIQKAIDAGARHSDEEGTYFRIRFPTTPDLTREVSEGALRESVALENKKATGS